jgi:hypothetical protein
MPSTPEKKRPKGVPEENVYLRTHWTLYIAMLAAIATLYFILTAA